MNPGTAAIGVLAALAVVACGPGAGTTPGAPPPSQEDASPGRPDLSGLSAEVRDELESRRDAVDERRTGPDVTDADRAAAWGDLGTRYHAYGVLEAAAASYRAAAAGDASDFRWPYYLGLVRLQQARLDEAAEAFAEAARLAPDYVPARIRIGEIRLEQNRLDDAVRAFRAALDLDATSAAAHDGLGRALAARGDHAGAASALEAALALQPGATRIHYTLGQAYRNLGRLDEARKHLDRFGDGEVVVGDRLLAELGRLTGGETARLQRGRTALRIGLVERGMDEYRAAVEEYPGSAEARRQYARVLGRFGRIDEAVEQARAAAELEPERPGSHVLLATLLAAAEREDEAAGALRSALRLDPGNLGARLRLAVLLGRSGAVDDALGLYRSVLDSDPNHLAALRGTAEMLRRAGRLEQAIDAHRRWADAAPHRALPRVELAALLVESGDVLRARAVLEEAVGLEGEPPVIALARFRLGVLHAGAGDSDSAREHYRAALELEPGLHAARFNLAVEHVRRGAWDEARSEFARIVADDPDRVPARLGLAEALMWLERYDAARRALGDGLERSPSPELANALARLLATCPDASIRDGRRAVRLAGAALERAGTPEHLETLAMAYAEAGDFKLAVRSQSALIREAEKLDDAVRLERLRRHLDAYRAGRPLRAPWRSP